MKTKRNGINKMKIAFIVGRFPALSETFILNQITGLLNLGHDIEIFAVLKNNEKKVHPDIEKYNLMEKVSYFSIPQNQIIRLFKALYLVTVNFNKSPSKVINSLNVFKYGRAALSLRLLYYLVPFLGKKFDIIQCHFGSIGNIGAMLKQLGIEGKLVTMFHGCDIREGLNKGGKIYKNLFLPNNMVFHPCNL